MTVSATGPLHVLLTLHDYVRSRQSGAVATVHALHDGLVARGHDVECLSFDDLPPRLGTRERFVLFPLFVAQRAAQLSRNRLRVVDAATADAWVWSLRRRRGGPLLVTRSHGLEHVYRDALAESARRNEASLSWKYPLYHGGVRLWEVKASLRRADLVTFPNSSERDYAVARLGVDPRRARVLEHGLPQELVGLPLEPTPESGVVRLAAIGCHTERKGVRFVVPALSSVLRRHPTVRATLLGGHSVEARDRYDADVRGQIDTLGEYALANLPALLRNHHVVVHPSLAEGFGKSLIEAMACGLAPVATPVGGAADILRDGANGLIVPLRDGPAIERALRRLIEDRALLDRLRRSAHTVAQRFAWNGLIEQRLALYDEFLERRNGG
jgi:glycosyltransferase involved in cell wall biosynthesis